MRTILLQLERPWRTAGAIFAASVLITLLFQAVLPTGLRVAESTDYAQIYEPVARNILAGRGITIGAGTPATTYPPGYPLILAGLFGLSGLLNLPEGVAHVALASLAMGISCALVYAVARTVWRPAAALVAPLIWMTYPGALWLTKQPNSEIPFFIVFYGAFCLVWYALIEPRGGGHRRYFVAGLLVGAAALIRPIAIGVGVVFAVVIWLARRDLPARLRLGLVTSLLLGNLVAVFPWEVWVYQQTGRVAPLSTNGAVSMQDGLVFALDPLGYRQEIKIPGNVQLLMQDASARSTELRSLRDIVAFMAGELKERPVAVGELLALKVARSWYGTDSGRHEAALLLIQAVYLGVVLWASVAAWKRGGPSKQLAVATWMTGAYFWGMTALVLPLLRYMVPAIGLLFVLLPVLVQARAVRSLPFTPRATDPPTSRQEAIPRSRQRPRAPSRDGSRRRGRLRPGSV